MPHVGRKSAECGVSLLEVLIAISLLGVGFAAIFSGLSAALRTTDRLDRYESSVDYATEKLNELVLDPTLAAGQRRSGVLAAGIRWQAETQLVETRPLADPNRPAQLVLISLEVSWNTPRGRQSFALQTMKLCLPSGDRVIGSSGD